MYVNVVYGVDENPNIEDMSTPLRINNCGYYRVHTGPVIKTYHPQGRNDYQLLYIESGKGYFYINNDENVVSKGHMILYKPGEPQVYNYFASDKTEVYWVHFTGSKAEEYLRHYGFNGEINEKKIIYTGTSPDFKLLYNQIIREMQLQRPNHSELSVLLFNQLLLTVNRYIKEGLYTDNNISEIEKSINFFNENYNSNISIEQYASNHLMSTNWFIHCFKNVMKMTPMQYILSLRISAAKTCLESTDKNITEIAETVGYDNPLYFSRIFRKHTGFAPTEYRKKISQTST